MRFSSTSSNTLRGLLVAPAPSFALMCLIFVTPRFGLLDCLLEGGLAIAGSYGFMFVAGVPTHIFLRRLQWQSWPHYFWGFSLALAIVAGVITALEGNPSDSSGSMFVTLGGDRWLALFALWLPFVAVMATMFWDRAVDAEDQRK